MIATGKAYERGPSVRLSRDATRKHKQLEIKEMEVFCVSETSPPTTHLSGNQCQNHCQNSQGKQIDLSAQDINKAMTANRDALLQLELLTVQLESNFMNEQYFITAFAGGDSN